MKGETSDTIYCQRFVDIQPPHLYKIIAYPIPKPWTLLLNGTSIHTFVAITAFILLERLPWDGVHLWELVPILKKSIFEVRYWCWLRTPDSQITGNSPDSEFIPKVFKRAEVKTPCSSLESLHTNFIKPWLYGDNFVTQLNIFCIPVALTGPFTGKTWTQ